MNAWIGFISVLFISQAAIAQENVTAEVGQVSKLYIINAADGRTTLSFADGFQIELKQNFSAPENEILKVLNDTEKAAFQRNRAKIIGDFVRLMRWKKLRNGLGAVDGDSVFQLSADAPGHHPLLKFSNTPGAGLSIFDRVIGGLAQVLDHYVIQKAPIIARTEDLGLRYDLGLAFTNTIRILTGWNIPTTLAVSFGWDRTKKKYVFHIFADEAKEGTDKLIKKITFMGQLSFYTAKTFVETQIGGRTTGVTSGTFTEFSQAGNSNTIVKTEPIRSTWSLARLEIAEFSLGSMQVHADIFRVVAGFLNAQGYEIPKLLARYAPESARKPTKEKVLACRYVFLRPPAMLGTWSVFAK